jgi:hypothetical protein
MIDASGGIQTNPMRLSAYRTQPMVAKFVTWIQEGAARTGVELIDLTRNFCWEDLCAVVDPYGNPIFKDSNHFRPFAARHYL